MENAAYSRADCHADFSETMPLLDVIEGSEDSDWAAWEDSVALQDSQRSELCAETQTAQIRSSERTGSEEIAIDPFGSVHRRSG